jgi:hypothetical protein
MMTICLVYLICVLYTTGTTYNYLEGMIIMATKSEEKGEDPLAPSTTTRSGYIHTEQHPALYSSQWYSMGSKVATEIERIELLRIEIGKRFQAEKLAEKLAKESAQQSGVSKGY